MADGPVGIAATLVGRYQSDGVRVVIYLVMGWAAVVVMVPLWDSLPGRRDRVAPERRRYSVGAIFYTTNRPRLWPGVFAAHDLWHVFVLAGDGAVTSS